MLKLGDEAQRKEQALILVRALRYGRIPDEEVGEKIAELERLIPTPHWVDLMFHQIPDLSDEEVVDRAMEYRPFEL